MRQANKTSTISPHWIRTKVLNRKRYMLANASTTQNFSRNLKFVTLIFCIKHFPQFEVDDCVDDCSPSNLTLSISFKSHEWTSNPERSDFPNSFEVNSMKESWINTFCWFWDWRTAFPLRSGSQIRFNHFSRTERQMLLFPRSPERPSKISFKTGWLIE